MLKAVFYSYLGQETDEMRSMPYTFPAEPYPGDNKTIWREQAFHSPDTQIEVYPTVPAGGYDIIGCQTNKGTAVFEPFHQVYIYCFSDFFVFVHIVDFTVYPLKLCP
jgi:hypothetical protein